MIHAITPDQSLIVNLVKDRTFFKFSIDAEGNDSWNLMLEKKNYEKAYELSLKQGKEVSDQIGCLLAQQLFDSKKYMKAAKLYSTIDMPFERILLQFLEKIDEDVDAQYGLISSLEFILRSFEVKD